MSGMNTSYPIVLICNDHGMDVETYKSELDCVLSLINNGRLGKGVDSKAIGWGSDAHAAAVKHVIEHAQRVAEEIAAEQLIEAALGQQGSAA